MSTGVNLLLTGISCVLIIRCKTMSGRMKRQAMCLQVLNKTKNAKLRKKYTRTRRPRAHTRSVRMRAQHPARERANDVAREGATAEVQDQITSDSAHELERNTETSEPTADGWIPTGAVSPVGGYRHRTVGTSTACVKKRCRGRGPEGLR